MIIAMMPAPIIRPNKKELISKLENNFIEIFV